jgi:O-antigen biosynthesis protein
VEPGQPDWLAEITGPLAIPGVGLTGARLLDAQTGLLRHCGLVIAKSGRVESIYAGQPKNVNGPAGLVSWYRNWTAVSGACFAIRREVWDEVGGFSGELAHARPDVALCLKVHRQTSWRIAYNPFAWLFQSREAALETPLADERPCDLSVYFPNGDPHFNANLDCQDGRVVLDNPRQPNLSASPRQNAGAVRSAET